MRTSSLDRHGNSSSKMLSKLLNIYANAPPRPRNSRASCKPGKFGGRFLYRCLTSELTYLAEKPRLTTLHQVRNPPQIRCTIKMQSALIRDPYSRDFKKSAPHPKESLYKKLGRLKMQTVSAVVGRKCSKKSEPVQKICDKNFARREIFFISTLKARAPSILKSKMSCGQSKIRGEQV